MLSALVLAGCLATTSIPEFKESVQGLCVPGVVNADVSGDHKELRIRIDFAQTNKEMREIYADPTARTMLTVGAVGAARDCFDILKTGRSYPVETLIWVARDGEGAEMCTVTVKEVEAHVSCAAGLGVEK